MASLGLEPDFNFQLPVQTVIFILGLVSANVFFVRPALRLHLERKKRTSGKLDAAKSFSSNAQELESNYLANRKAGQDAARSLRVSEVLSAQSEAEVIVDQAQSEAKAVLDGVNQRLSVEIERERQKIPGYVDEIVENILKKLTGNTGVILAIFVFGQICFRSLAFASGGSGPVEAMSGIFWPYFQFLCFLAFLIFFGRKAVLGMLEGKRDSLRLQLSEAREAEQISQRKVNEFKLKLESLESEILEMRNQNVEDGLTERRKILDDAHRLAQQILADASRMAEDLVVAGKEKIREELVESVLEKIETRLDSKVVDKIDEQLKTDVFDLFQKTQTIV